MEEECEKQGDTNFIRSTGNKMLEAENTTRIYFYCNRSGYYNSLGTRKRSMKSQGTSKLNNYCTASMTVTKTGKKLCVEYCKTHHGHTFQLGHLRMAEKDRKDIAMKLHQGISFYHILNEVRMSVGSKFDRIHLLTNKDISNIEKAFGIQSAQRHNDDATSVYLLVKEMEQNTQYNPILLYKQQSATPQGKFVKLYSNDFILVLQTELQAEMLQKFGPQIICIDDTHGTNGYNFTLVTIMVVDEFGEGFPVAWCFSNRQDKTAMEIFFQSVKDKVGNITPQWIMTDDAEQFFSAWILTFGSGPSKLLCTWHVDRAWRGQLNQIRSQVLAATLYKNLRIMLEEPNVDTFEKLLKETIEQLSTSESTKSFCTYFQSHYVPRKQQWATCYRTFAGINTNMYVESFHRTLKYIYMKGRVNKRMDKCIEILLNLARDKAFQRLIKLEKGKSSAKVKIINNRHKQSLHLDQKQVKQQDDTLWIVLSTDGSTEYTVKQNQSSCTHQCSVRCSECRICVHQYTCTCMDHLTLSTICKHIHLIAYTCTSTSSDETNPTHYSGEKEVVLKSLQYVDSIDKNHKKESLRLKVLSLLTHIDECIDTEALNKTEKLVERAMLVLQTDFTSQPFPSTQISPSNTKVTPQKSFFSTKRKRVSKNVRLAKPSQEQ